MAETLCNKRQINAKNEQKFNNMCGLPRWRSGKKNPPAKQEMKETLVRSLDQKNPLEKEMATRSSILVWKVPWT